MAISNEQELSGSRVQANQWLTSETRALAGWVGVAFLLRIFFLWRVEQAISPDGVAYVRLGRNLVAGNFREGLSAYWSPLYPLLVGLSSLVFRDAEFAGRFVSVVAGSLLVIPAHSLIRRCYGARVALIGASMVALHPLLIYYSTVLLTESTYTLFFTCGVLAGWSALNGVNARSYFLTGAIFGACYLLKPETAGFVLLLLALVVSRKFFDKTRTLKETSSCALLLVVGFMLPAAPYLFYLRHATGAWTLSAKLASHMWQGSRSSADGAPVINAVVPDATIAFVQLTKALRFEYEMFNLIFPIVFVALATLGLFRKRWTQAESWRELYLFAFVAATLAGYAVTLPNIRFLVPLLPILLCWTSKGVVEFADWLRETLSGFRVDGGLVSRLQKFIVPLVVAVSLASLMPLLVYLVRGDKWGDYGGQKRAGVWIKEHDDGAPVIMSTEPIAAFYAKGRHVPLFDEDYAAFIARARREGVKHVIVNQREFKFMDLRSLLDENAAHPGLRLAYRIAEMPEHKILVYDVEATERDAPPPQRDGQDRTTERSK